MEIKKARYKKVMVLQRREISPAVYGCDECRKEIKEYPNEDSRLEISVFYNQGQTEHFHFCSWKCVLKYISKVKTDYFVSLPMMYFDSKSNGNRSARALQDILQKAKLAKVERKESDTRS